LNNIQSLSLNFLCHKYWTNREFVASKDLKTTTFSAFSFTITTSRHLHSKFNLVLINLCTVIFNPTLEPCWSCCRLKVSNLMAQKLLFKDVLKVLTSNTILGFVQWKKFVVTIVDQMDPYIFCQEINGQHTLQQLFVISLISSRWETRIICTPLDTHH